MRLIPTVGDYLPLLAAAFLVAALLSLVLTPLVRRVAIRLGNVDHPGGRRVNKAPVPRGGGVAVAVSFLVVALGGIWFNGQTGTVPVPRTIEPAALVGLLAGGVVATALGVLDDTFQLRARWQLLASSSSPCSRSSPGSRSRSSPTRSGPATSSSLGRSRSGSRCSGSWA